MYSNTKFSGKHLIIDIKNIKNEAIINDIDQLKTIMNSICEKYNFNVLQQIEHQFEPHGISIVYLLSESHMTIHTFPEKKYIAFDLYTCREYLSNEVYHEIHNYIVEEFQCDLENPQIVDREF